MEKNRVANYLAGVCALYFIGSAVVAHAQTTTLPFTPTMTAGGTALVNQQVLANADGSYTVTGAQQGGGSVGAPVWGTAAISYMLDGRQWVVTPAGLNLTAFALPPESHSP